MFRIIATAVRVVGANASRIAVTNSAASIPSSFSSCSFNQFSISRLVPPPFLKCDIVHQFWPVMIQPQSRTLTKFSLKKGKRKTVKAVLKRFYRLNWGAWIRTRAGRKKRLWKKSGRAKQLYQEHCFCNGTQSWLLDKMVTNYWRKPKYYVDDPYQSYHSREEFYITQRKPVVSK